MRNLQKILALALALMMSFSLVVTANAAFSDDADINETYSESVNVLAQLEVFKGYNDGSYQPKADITRAEVAAIIYRIATGDVTDSQVSLYSDWNRFKDVSSESWYAGYVNYCANAEYIKGYGDGNFRPQQNVTGYEALAMILRAVGYGKMDEFVGSDWAVNTAARANTLKISRNVTAALLGSPASREVVAELLFRSILVPTVTYNNAFGYQETDTTLAYNSFKLEQIEGVVVANEYANLYDTQVLDAGKTDFETAKGQVRSLDITSEITAIGEAHYAYVSGAKVYALENTGDNVVFEPENGKGTKIEGSNFLKNTGLKKDDDTEFYLNFGREGKFTCDQRLEFQVVFYTKEAYDAFVDKYEDIGAYAYKCQQSATKDDDWTVESGKYTDTDKDGVAELHGTPYTLPEKYTFPTTTDNDNYILFNRIIRAKDEITAEEMDIIEGIFAAADNILGNGQDRDQVTGDVYLGTKSNIDKDDKERDISNEISFRKFKDEYINSEIWDQDIENSGNGEWLKVVDNDGDGIAEYAFLTEYTLDKAISSYTKSGETILEYNSMDIEDIQDNDGIIDYTEEIAVGDVVYYTKIDNRYTITKSPVVKATIQTVTFKDDSCTTTDGETYTESDIDNESRLDQLVANLDDQVEYNLYFDAYGWLRAYELANGNTYGLLTELYRTTSQNVQYVKGEDLTVELKKGSAKIDEFGVDNSKDNVFLLDVNRSGIAANNWANLERDILALSSHAWYKNVYSTSAVEDPSTILLQPAVGQLGLEYATDGRSAETAMRNVTTNVAVYTETADGEVRLTSPVKLAKDINGKQYYYVSSELTGEKTTDTSKVVDKDGNKLTGNALDARKAYQVDYIELDLSDGVKADAKHYPIADSAANHSRYKDQNGSYNNYVDAVHDTEFYVVNTETKKNIDYFTDYEKVYELKAEDIIAAYAVAKNIESDYAKSDYWVADVIVIEVSNVETIYDSVGVLYNNPSQTTGNVKLLDTLNTESENPEIQMIPEEWEWANRRNGKWAYEIDENEVKDGVLYADSIAPIYSNFNAKGLYAGTVTRMRDIKDRGGYIDIRMNGTNELELPVTGKNVSAWTRGISVDNDKLFAIGSTNGSEDANNTTRSLRVTYNAITNRLDENHRVIWGEDKDGHVAFVIDVDFRDDDWYAPNWLTAMDTNGLWYAIAREQVSNRAGYTFAEALEAYLAWQADKTEDNAKKALAIIESAKSHKDTTDKQLAQLTQMENEVKGNGSGSVDGLSAEDTARALIKARNEFYAAHAAANTKYGGDAAKIAADEDVIKTKEAFQKAATAYAKLTDEQKATISGTVASPGPHTGVRKAAEDTMNTTPGALNAEGTTTIGNVLTNVADINSKGAGALNTAALINGAKASLDAVTSAEEALYAALADGNAKSYNTNKTKCENAYAKNEKLLKALDLVKKGYADDQSLTVDSATQAASKKAALEAWNALTAKEQAAVSTLDNGANTAAITWIGTEVTNTTKDAEITKVALKKGLDKVVDWKVVTENKEYTLTVPATVTVNGSWLDSNVNVTSVGTAGTWTYDSVDGDYDVYTLTVAGTGTPIAGKEAVVTIKVLTKEEGAPADILDKEISEIKVTDKTDPADVKAEITIGTAGETVVSSNLADFNENVYDMGVPSDDEQLVAVNVNLKEYLEKAGMPRGMSYKIVQTNEALKKCGADGFIDPSAGTKTKAGYELNDLDQFGFFLFDGHPVVLEITIDVSGDDGWNQDGTGGTDTAGDDVVLTIRIWNDVTIVF